MLSGNYGPSAAEFQRSGGAGYAGWYARAKSHAIALEDGDHPNRSQIKFTCASSSGLEGRTEVQLWDHNRQAAIRFVSGSLVEEQCRAGVLTTRKTRDIAMTSDADRGLLKIEDRFTQAVHEVVGATRRDLVDDQRERVLVTSLDDGTVLATGSRDCQLLFDSGWSIEEFQHRKQDLGL